MGWVGAPRDFCFFEKCNFWLVLSAAKVLAARPYQSEHVCKSWGELVKISVSYDKNKFSIVFINETLHIFMFSFKENCSY